ncbi:uncharacterized protein Gasu_05020 [Galdieria sulphuraria]|uniref:Sucrose phosphatase-like domain-containing protein n=1 Tax=Galdieria sulphuraria TaxID=130081 RepID=M2W977_GALSU|nr:uncharacterized protein Gasu_05020 [Galdieria sulphuraria]EME32416.1 hypothetical protein Gasu_05020 [Galdieria sulphuraria]|eukprot:XP_005708936.1 hypothetical protein Gasu_05020 [Galdieria sulphuraria]
MAYFSWVTWFPRCECCKRVSFPRPTQVSRLFQRSLLKRSSKRYQLCRTSSYLSSLCCSTRSSLSIKDNRVCFLVADVNTLSRSTKNEPVSSLLEGLSIVKKNFGRFHYFVISEDSLQEVEGHISESFAKELKPEVIITFGGAQIFQLGFREPDPSWEEQVMKEWEPKPVQSLIESTLKEAKIGYLECRKIYSSEFPLSSMPKIPLVLQYTLSEDIETGQETLISLLLQKLRENGLKASIRRGSHERSLDIAPSTVTSIGAFEFICSMLNIDEDSRVVLLLGDSPSIHYMKKHLKASILCHSFNELESVLSSWTPLLEQLE